MPEGLEYDKERCARHYTSINSLEKANIVMHEDIKHIKGRLDNGISQTVTKIWDKLNNEIAPNVRDNTYWVGVWKKSIVFLAISGVLMGSVALAFHLIRS